MWLLEKIFIAYVDHTIFLWDRAILAYIRNSYIAGEKKSGTPRGKWVKGMNRQFAMENSYGQKVCEEMFNLSNNPRNTSIGMRELDTYQIGKSQKLDGFTWG